jgi:uncharacterized membrane protein
MFQNIQHDEHDLELLKASSTQKILAAEAQVEKLHQNLKGYERKINSKREQRNGLKGMIQTFESSESLTLSPDSNQQTIANSKKKYLSQQAAVKKQQEEQHMRQL